MQANIKGLVDRLELSQAKAMMPLYEAISNAVDAIEEHQDGFSNHSIRIRLFDCGFNAFSQERDAHELSRVD